MLLVTIAITKSFVSLSYVDRFVVSMLFRYIMSNWWIGSFGAPNESVTSFRPLVLNVRANNVDYTRVNTYAECLALERSWYLSDSAFFVHLDHSVMWEGVDMQYGLGQGFSDTDIVYIDDAEYLPLIKNSPSINKSEDIQGYQKLRLISGNVGLSNLGTRLAYLNDSNVIGNEARLSYISNDAVTDNIAQAVDLVDQATYFVEQSEYGNAEVNLSLQDIRSLNKEIPTRTFETSTYPFLNDSDDGKIVPLIYGACRSVKCVPVTSSQTGTTNATFRVGELLTSISEVRVKIDDTWTIMIPSSTDLANGTFTILDARKSISDAPYECEADVVGIPVTHATDIIVDMYSRYLNQEFITAFYDVNTWDANKITIPTCGFVIDSQKSILEIIPDIQNGVYPTFRFDITPNGKKTIRVDDKTRSVDYFVDSIDILNTDSLKAVDISDYLFGDVTIEYDKNYNHGDYRRKKVTTYQQSMTVKYQWANSTSISTLLNIPSLAQAMADAKALEFSVPIRTLELILMGSRYFSVELFDIMQVDTTVERDEYYTGEFAGLSFLGVVVGQVIGIIPNYSDLTTTVKVKILNRSPEVLT